MAYEAGKGGKPRPFSVTQEEFGNNHERIYGKKPPRPQYVPPPLPDMDKEPKKIDWGNDAETK